ncbi:ABC transporter permease [Marinithermus hydrothermalis]|uniref:ABC3 transporter permease protein domain-containing protein n=1 Tax=Marinithermus hydrothermalis (strain DSM 14884 / JCM 11576 / T1) TaxID=869210 RepID=F2NQ38_MARHT|nr:ABC transporter permease [Marinithermus hydrothermalis]AEB11349.1 protein of unknown function DUF214 [Marinithermus hydrothermalis DSM 14884]
MEIAALVSRNLLARPVRTGLTLLGIIVATSAMVLFLSFGEGLRKALIAEIARVGPEIQVLPEGSSGFSAPLPEIRPEEVARLEAEAERIGIRQVIPLLLLFRGGFGPGDQFLFEGLPDGVLPTAIFPNLKVQKGTLDPDAGAVVGALVAERHRLELGKELRLNREVSVRVAGILEESGGLADSLIFVRQAPLRAVLDTTNYSLVLLDLAEGVPAEQVAEEVEALLPGLDAQTMSEVMRFAERALRISDIVRFGISLVALVVGGLLVANTVMMGVYERIREFGVMRAIGAKRRFIFSLVLAESLALSLTGGLLGVGLGSLGSWAVNLYTTEAVGIALSAVTPRLALFALGVALTLGLLSGLFPARTASRIPVVEALGRI